MKEAIKYSSIGQFRQIIKAITHKTRFLGLDESGVPQYDSLKPLPVIEVVGTEKIHGTNGAVGYSESFGFWVQSKNNIITPENDNLNCASLIYEKKPIWESLIKNLAQYNHINLKENIVILYFELAGMGIQKKSACSGLSKRFIIFPTFRVMNIKELENKENRVSSWLYTKIDSFWVSSPENLIFNVMNFPFYKIEIDFNNPEKAHNEMIDLMIKVEENSPLGTQMGIDGNVGEGLVFEFLFKNERFAWKVKGEKHSNSKIKKMNPIDLEKLNKIDQLVEKITHNWRFEQGLQEVFGNDYEKNISRAKLGSYLKWVAQDTIKEEIDLIKESGLEQKDVMKKVQQKARNYFFQVEQDV